MISFLLDWSRTDGLRNNPQIIIIRKKIHRTDAVIFNDKHTPWKLVREGTALSTLIHWGVKIPELYIDFHENIRRSKDDQLIMMGPTWSKKLEDNRQDPPF